MFDASAAFTGGDIQNFGEGGRTYMGGLDNPLETMHIYLLQYIVRVYPNQNQPF